MKAAFLCLLLLAGCVQVPAGVQMSDEEEAACKAKGCNVWTEDEFMQVLKEAYRRGYQAGVKSI